MVYGVEVAIDDSELLQLTEIGEGLIELNEDGTFSIAREYYLRNYRRSTLAQLKSTAERVGVKRRGVGWVKSCPPNGLRDDILAAIIMKEQDEDRAEQEAARLADQPWGAYERDQANNQPGFHGIPVGPRHLDLVGPDENDEDSDLEHDAPEPQDMDEDEETTAPEILPLTSLALLKIMESVDNKGDFEKIITEEPVSSVWEATAEICTSRPRFEAKVDYPLHSPDETFPDHITDELYDRFLDWRNGMEWENHSPKGMLQKLLAPINSRHPFADKLKGLHLEAMNHWGGEDNNKYFIVSDELGAGIGVGRESPARIFQKDVDVSPPSDFTKLAFADAIDELSRKGVIIKTTQQPRWIFLATSNSDY